MINFIKKYIFFRVSPEEKKAIRDNVFKSDYKGYKIGLIVIALYEVFNVIRDIFNFVNDGQFVYKANMYLDIALLVVSVIFLIILLVVKNAKTIPGFIMIHSMMCVILIWGISKSVLDSMEAPNIVAFAYVSIALAVFVSMEPWLILTDLTLATIFLNVTCLVAPSVQITVHSFLDSIAVWILGSMLTIITFYRRNKSLLLEIQVYSLNEELKKKAYFDDLTGLHNRRFLSENMNKPLSVSDVCSGVILMDIDNFKKINDEYGHLSGDRVLRDIGFIIRNNQHADYSVRYGGEEILLFFQNTNTKELFEIAEEIRNGIANSIFAMENGTQKKITASFGVAVAKIEMSYNKMIDNADEALYQAKKNGKNQTIIYEQSIE